MQVEGVFRQALELSEPDFRHAPEPLDAVDVDGAPHEFILGMVNAEMAVAEIDQAVVAAPPIGVDDGARVDPAADDALECGLRAVRDDLGIDMALPFEDAEDDGLAVGAAPPPALDAARRSTSVNTSRDDGDGNSTSFSLGFVMVAYHGVAITIFNDL